MYLFNLPYTTVVNRVIPKNAFDKYANTKQRRLFTDRALGVTWTHKISPYTVNLEAREIREIQVFEIELKFREDMKTILDIIDKAIPYHIIFIPAFTGEAYISLSVKHPHPGDEKIMQSLIGRLGPTGFPLVKKSMQFSSREVLTQSFMTCVSKSQEMSIFQISQLWSW